MSIQHCKDSYGTSKQAKATRIVGDESHLSLMSANTSIINRNSPIPVARRDSSHELQGLADEAVEPEIEQILTSNFDDPLSPEAVEAAPSLARREVGGAIEGDVREEAPRTESRITVVGKIAPPEGSTVARRGDIKKAQIEQRVKTAQAQAPATAVAAAPATKGAVASPAATPVSTEVVRSVKISIQVKSPTIGTIRCRADFDLRAPGYGERPPLSSCDRPHHLQVRQFRT
jgi:hypothetical protein